jgi:hypothetical protein
MKLKARFEEKMKETPSMADPNRWDEANQSPWNASNTHRTNYHTKVACA